MAAALGVVGGKMTVRRSLIEGNSAPINIGGGVAVVLGDFRMDQSTVQGQPRPTRGGGHVLRNG